MLTTSEKRSAILAQFPNVPKQDLGRIAAKIVTDSDLYHVRQIVFAWIRHSKTVYDTISGGMNRYGTMRKEAYNAAYDAVGSIAKLWS